MFKSSLCEYAVMQIYINIYMAHDHLAELSENCCLWVLGVN